MTFLRTPASTYRLQLNANFNFSQAASVVSYLNDLGITDLYTSPLFKARRGSLHGYSVTNPLELNPELGPKAAFDSLCKKVRSLGMGLLLDVVPNHMALSRDNPWWQEVLENGPSSPYAVFFDLEWDPPYRTLKNRILLPVLGRPYGQCLEDQELSVALTENGFVVRYYDHAFPLDPKTYLSLLTYRLDELKPVLGEDNPDFIRLAGIISLIHNLPPRNAPSAKKKRERIHWSTIIKKSLWLLRESSPLLKDFISENLRQFNGRRGDPASFDLLDNLLRVQPYRLACWLVSLEMINYRRFFSINDLIGIRVEDPRVFDATHHLLFKLVEDDKITGLRLDHVDGLYDPEGYLHRLQNRLQAIKNSEPGKLFYLVTEKILEDQENLPDAWPIAGTTGYDFLNILNNVFLVESGLGEVERIYRAVCGLEAVWEDVVYDKKKLIMATLFGGEVRNLEEHLLMLASKDRQAMDCSRQDLLQALIEVTACLPVYRTYISSQEVSSVDCGYLEKALTEAGQKRPALKEPALSFLRRVLMQEYAPGLPENQKKNWLRFVSQWQQFTGPVMAKGLEDTAAYVYNPLISLNEVGCLRRAVGIREFHAWCEARQRRWPVTLNATSTHDTKRSEDVRARLNVLTEMPEFWHQCLLRWRQWNKPRKAVFNGQEVPDANEEVFLYQTMLGAWPLQTQAIPDFKERLKQYLIKAIREAKVHSRWVNPNPEYEQLVIEFAEAILSEGAANQFLPDFLACQQRLAFYGALNSLSQVLLKTTSPGIPDFYQGTELWDFSLVDPDNRRPVDFKHRQKLLSTLKLRESKKDKIVLHELLTAWRDGRLKLLLIYQALQVRKTHRELFLRGEYLPLSVAGTCQEHVIAFARRLDQQWVLTLAGRFFSRLTEPETWPLGEKLWGDTHLILPQEAPDSWRDEITGVSRPCRLTDAGRLLPLAAVFSQLPAALLRGVAQ